MNDAKLKEIEDFLLQYTNRSIGGKFPGELGIERTKYFLSILGNPQEKIQVIHIAGTSGKGSTATILSNLLQGQGYKVGLTLSPHVIDFRERVQIDNEYLDIDRLHEYFELVKDKVKEMEQTKYGPPTYFEIVIGLVFYTFLKESVDYIVIETGLGGLLDGTNVVENPNKLCILTRIGLDHTAVLGDTLEEIAYQKAGIIHPKNRVVYLEQSEKINEVFYDRAYETNAQLYPVIEGETFENVSIEEQGTCFDFNSSKLPLKKIQTNLIGFYQAENTSLALTALELLLDEIDERKLINTLQRINLVGRFQISQYKDKKIILDAAHNPQKIAALVNSIKNLYPKEKFSVLFAVKKKKEYKKIIKSIIQIADEMVLTSYRIEQDMINESVDFAEVEKILSELGFNNFKSLELEKALDYLAKTPNNILVTGSMYLVGAVIQEGQLE